MLIFPQLLVVTAGDSRRSSISEASTVGEQEQWQEVGPKNRTANTRSVSLFLSPFDSMAFLIPHGISIGSLRLESLRSQGCLVASGDPS